MSPRCRLLSTSCARSASRWSCTCPLRMPTGVGRAVTAPDVRIACTVACTPRWKPARAFAWSTLRAGLPPVRTRALRSPWGRDEVPSARERDELPSGRACDGCACARSPLWLRDGCSAEGRPSLMESCLRLLERWESARWGSFGSMLPTWPLSVSSGTGWWVRILGWQLA